MNGSLLNSIIKTMAFFVLSHHDYNRFGGTSGAHILFHADAHLLCCVDDCLLRRAQMPRQKSPIVAEVETYY